MDAPGRFGALFDRHATTLFRYLVRRVGPRAVTAAGVAADLAAGVGAGPLILMAVRLVANATVPSRQPDDGAPSISGSGRFAFWKPRTTEVGAHSSLWTVTSEAGEGPIVLAELGLVEQHEKAVLEVANRQC